VIFALAALVGYLIGAVSPATWIAARRGIDLRGVGSGNPGATYAGRALGRRTGVVVAASRWVALASVLAAVSILVIAVVVGEDVVWGAVLAAVVVARHQTNFVRRLARD
jgi:glycerol-3-phosphate acyltransferase PlsY